jgi:hypothetical protein
MFTNVDKAAWNPTLLEITAALQSADDPRLWAMYTHQQRFPDDYPDGLKLPHVLHLAELATEYALPHEYKILDEDSDDGSAAENPAWTTQTMRPTMSEELTGDRAGQHRHGALAWGIMAARRYRRGAGPCGPWCRQGGPGAASPGFSAWPGVRAVCGASAPSAARAGYAGLRILAAQRENVPPPDLRE